MDECTQELRRLDGLTPSELAQELYTILDDMKAKDVKILNVEGRSDICDAFVLATATSTTHVKSLAGNLEWKASERGLAPLHVEGRGGNQWMVLDFGCVIVHIFTRDLREFYHLERLYPQKAE